MTAKEYTLCDAEDKLNNIAHMSMFLQSGACPSEMSVNLYDHMHDEIETLQAMLGYMKVYPQIKAEEQLDSPQKELTP